MSWQHPDSLRATLDSVFAAPAYRWIERPDPLTAIRMAWARLVHTLLTFADAHPFAANALQYMLGLMILAVIVRAGWRFSRSVRSAEGFTGATDSGVTARDQAWYRAEADRLAGGGRFAEAIQADFLALVLALDARAVLRFHPSKTPAEYVQEAALAPGARAEFRELVGRLYRYAFARTPCGEPEFQDWRTRTVPDLYAPAH